MPVVRAAAAALAFLTIVPTGRWSPGDVARGAAFFPVVGAGLGAAVAAVATGLAGPLPSLAAAAVALALGALLTGGLHLDALADTADALGARSRSRALEVMRDPRIGSFGALALTLDLLAKASALAALAADSDAVLAVLAAAAAARATAPALAVALPPARADGSGAPLTRGRPAAAAIAAVIAVIAAISATGWTGLAILGAVAAVAVAVGLVARGRFGGVTGDVLGCAIELGETAALLTAAALL
jgi:adenosylcobinamide-GDP ribazoletransferase